MHNHNGITLTSHSHTGRPCVSHARISVQSNPQRHQTQGYLCISLCSEFQHRIRRDDNPKGTVEFLLDTDWNLVNNPCISLSLEKNPGARLADVGLKAILASLCGMA